jgi:hypothetical protein
LCAPCAAELAPSHRSGFTILSTGGANGYA